MDDSTQDDLIPWRTLGAERQLRLREGYAADPQCLTGTCSLEAKTAHFAEWLAERGVAFAAEDLHPGRKG